MTVTVTRKPGGVTQLFNTETGRVTYKCKAESAYMQIEAFGGIVQFNQKGAIATVTGHITSLESCDVIKKGHPNYKDALCAIILAHKEFARNVSNEYQNKIQELENKLSGL
jgi:phage-related minor tail protein